MEKQKKVIVGISGGVDSSTVAGLMKKEGYNVTGITLKLYDDAKFSKESRQCCAGQDILDAKRVSQKLNIDHKILYYQKKFKKDVIDNFDNNNCNVTSLVYSKDTKIDFLKQFNVNHKIALVKNIRPKRSAA